MATNECENRARAYWDDRLRRHWGPDGVGSVWLGRAFNAWRYRVRRRVFRHLVRRLGLDFAHASVLDVGCGTGVYLGEWQALGAASIAGLDFSDWALTQLARAYPSATFYRADIGAKDCPLPAAAFDMTSAIDVLVHLVDDARYETALRNMNAALKPGGYLIYSDAFFHGPDMQDGDYWKGRSLATVEAALRANDFEIVRRVPSSVLMSPPTDTRHRRRNAQIWDIAMSPVGRREWIGHLYGVVLYPIELLLVSTLRESPATELLVCRKRP
jgi:SAM-dependent methyltransferase